MKRPQGTVVWLLGVGAPKVVPLEVDYISPINGTRTVRPKSQTATKSTVKKKAQQLWSANVIKVSVIKVSDNKQAKKYGVPNGVYYSSCRVGGQVKATSWHLKRDMSLRGLVVELEKKFNEELKGNE